MIKKSKRGVITLFISIVLSVLLIVSIGAIDLTVVINAKSICSSAAELGLNSVLAGYDRKLFDNYGLIGTSASDISDNYQKSINSALNSDNTGLYKFISLDSDVTALYSLDDPAILENQINSYMKYRTLSDKSKKTEEMMKSFTELTGVENDYSVCIVNEEDMSEKRKYAWGDKLLMEVQAQIRLINKQNVTTVNNAINSYNSGKTNSSINDTLKKYYAPFVKIKECSEMLKKIIPDIEDLLGEQTGADVFYIDWYYIHYSKTEYDRAVKTAVDGVTEYNSKLNLINKKSKIPTVKKPAELNLLSNNYFEELQFSPGKYADDLLNSYVSESSDVVSELSNPTSLVSSGRTDRINYKDDWSLFYSIYDENAEDIFNNVDTWDDTFTSSDPTDKTAYTKIPYLCDFVSKIQYMPIGDYTTPTCDLINEYILQNFDTRLSSNNSHVVNNGEVEYIIAGSKDSGKNKNIVFNRIFGLRFYINYLTIYNSSVYSDLYKYASSIRYSGENACFSLEYFADNMALRWAMTEGYIETYIMAKRGGSIPLNKSPENMITSPYNLAKGININKVNAKTSTTDVTVDYNDYLWYLLNIENTHQKLLRTADIIQINMSKQLGKEYRLSKLNAYFSCNVAARIKLLFSSDDSDKESKILSRLDYYDIKIKKNGGY